MTLQEILTFSKLSESFTAQLEKFDALCTELCELTDQENDNFMAEMILPGAAVSLKKVRMLETFEQRAQHILTLIKLEAPTNTALQSYFLNRIQGLQGALRVNTSLQLHLMEQIHQKIGGQEVNEQCH